MEPKKSIFKIALGIILGVLVLAGVCSISGCGSGSSGSGSGAVSSTTPSPAPDTSGLPPDPGVNGKLTLVGVDADADGVRDDIQRYIALTYPNSAKTRAALTQYAKVIQAALLDANDKVKSVQHGEEVSKSSECLWYTLGSVDAAHKAGSLLREVALNTDERNRAYFAYDDKLGGEVFEGTPYDQRASTCTFDVSVLPN